MFRYTTFLIFCAFVLQIRVSNGFNLCTNTSSCPYTSNPEQIRLALHGPTGVTISWKTNGTIDGSNDTPTPTVEYSQNKNFSNSNFSYGISTNYVNKTYVSWFHNCVLNITAGKRYHYRILPCLCVNGSAKHSFHAQPPVGDSNPINIAIFGDLAAGNFTSKPWARQTIAALTAKRENIDLYQHNGDISYSDDHIFQHDRYESTWNSFQREMQVITTSKFYMTAPGNHEVTCDQFNDSICQENVELHPYRNFTAYFNRFRMPGDVSGGFKNMWYSYDFGSVHIIVIDTETDFPAAPAGPNTTLNGGNFGTNVTTQLEWLENDLKMANHNRSKVPWILMVGHRPMYTSIPVMAVENLTSCNACRNAFANLIYDYGVDFYFCGHVHWFERLFPVNRSGDRLANNYYKQPGPIHITTGAAGAPESIQKQENTTIHASARIISQYGFSILTIKNATDCELSFYNTQDNKIMEIVNITRLR